MIECHGISIICESNGTKNCTMKMTKDETFLSSDFLNMIPDYRRRDINGILNDTRYNWDEKRTRVNNYLKTYISYDIMKSYSKLLSDKLKKQIEEKFERTETAINKIFGEKFNFIKYKDNSFPSLKFDFSEKDFEKIQGKKYMRNEVYTGSYDQSFSQRISTEFSDDNVISSLNKKISRMPIHGFRNVYRPYRYCIPIC